MKVIIAESAGFCYGVKRALDTVLKALDQKGMPMYTLGPLIHNPQVIERLEKYGVRSVGSLDEIPAKATLVLPSHGVVKSISEQAQARGLDVIDVTCPFVRKVHRLAESLVNRGYQVIVLGDEGHTEVKGIMSRAGDDSFAVSDKNELAGRNIKKRVGIIAQTTQTVKKYERLVSKVSTRAYEIRAYNTICNATTDRQKAAVSTAKSVDVMIVVGGRNSANTRRLTEICVITGVPTHHVEIADEIDGNWFSDVEKVGITAGASTPDWIIKEVIRKVEEIPQD